MRKFQEKGASLLEMIISLGIVAVLFTPIFMTFFQVTKQSGDSEVVSLTEDRARSIRDIIAYDLRAAGSGMPLGQSNYTFSTTGVASDALPVLVGAKKNYIQFRISERGEGTLTTSDLTPSATDREFQVNKEEVGKFKVGQTVYLSNFTTGGVDGLRGTISSISGNTITLSSTFSSSPSATFPAGTLVQRVKTITLSSGTVTPTDGTGIMRDDGTGQGPILLGPNSRFELYYLTTEGVEIGTPISQLNINNNLAGILIKVFLASSKPISNGGHYIAEGTQVVALKNKLLGSMSGSDVNTVPPGDGIDDYDSSADTIPGEDSPTDPLDDETTTTTTLATTTTTTSTTTTSGNQNGNQTTTTLP